MAVAPVYVCPSVAHVYVCGGKKGQPSTCCEVLNHVKGKRQFVYNMNVVLIRFSLVSRGSFIWVHDGLNHYKKREKIVKIYRILSRHK